MRDNVSPQNLSSHPHVTPPLQTTYATWIRSQWRSDSPQRRRVRVRVADKGASVSIGGWPRS
jgi:hypothetical protein